MENVQAKILFDLSDHQYKKLLWREGINDSIKIFQLNTVTYGTTLAPFLNKSTLHKVIDDDHQFPLVSK